MVHRRWYETTADNRNRERKGTRETSGTAEEVAKWRKLDSKAKATIMLSVLDDGLTTITDATSSKEPGESSTAED